MHVLLHHGGRERERERESEREGERETHTHNSHARATQKNDQDARALFLSLSLSLSRSSARALSLSLSRILAAPLPQLQTQMCIDVYIYLIHRCISRGLHPTPPPRRSLTTFLFSWTYGYPVFCISRPRIDSELPKICRKSMKKLCILAPWGSFW